MSGYVHGAPWGTGVKLTTVLALGIACGAVYLVAMGLAGIPWLRQLVIGLLATLVVHRPGRETQIEFVGLTDVAYDPHAMKWSLRLLGNGGLFSLTGLWWNRKLDRYEAYVMDSERAVVLCTRRRTVVVSPDRPAEFVAVVNEACGL